MPLELRPHVVDVHRRLLAVEYPRADLDCLPDRVGRPLARGRPLAHDAGGALVGDVEPLDDQPVGEHTDGAVGRGSKSRLSCGFSDASIGPTKVVATPDGNLTPAPPATLDEEIIAAQEQGVLSTLTDAARIARIKRELQTGFDALAHVGPAASFFGSARTSPDDPEYALARETARIARRGRARGHHRRRPRRHGGRQPRRPRRRRALDRAQHRAAVRAGPQPVLRHRPRVPLLLHPQDHVRRATRAASSSSPAASARSTRRSRRSRSSRPARSGTSRSCWSGVDYWGGLVDWIRERARRRGEISPQDLDLICLTDDPLDVRDRLMSAAHRSGRTSVRNAS